MHLTTDSFSCDRKKSSLHFQSCEKQAFHSDTGVYTFDSRGQQAFINFHDGLCERKLSILDDEDRRVPVCTSGNDTLQPRICGFSWH